MNHRSVRKGLIVLAAAVGGACCTGRVAEQGRHTPTSCDHKPKDNVIEVTGSGVSCPDAEIKKNRDSMTWFSAANTKLKVIVNDDPFDDLRCSNNECTAYWVKATATLDKPYKYSTFVDGRLTSDPNIIIRP